MAGYRVSLHNLGCRVNRVELDAIASELIAAGCELVGESEAQLIVINTCAVTGEAEAKARKAVRHAASLPQSPWVIATGCVASLFADELSQLGERVVVEPVKKNVAGRVLNLAEGAVSTSQAKILRGSEACIGRGLSERAQASEFRRPTVCAANRNAQKHIAERSAEPSLLGSATVPQEVSITPTGRMRPGLKIQDGCDNRCTYCIVWKARGKATSVPGNDVIAGVNKLIADGAKEVVLTGIDLGRYSSEGLNLTGLCKLILSETSIGRIRLGSIEPAGVTPEFLELLASSNGRIAPFLHIPLQSGCDATLKRMNRPYTVAEYLQVIDASRAAVPDVALACDLIVGFPGESEEEFAESLKTCQDIGFANMHVFRYSKRPGTPAATMPNQVPSELSAQRSRAMRTCATASRRAYVSSLVGKEQLVLVEGKGLGVNGGLVECLVDDGLEGQLIRCIPSSVTSSGLLDMRSAHNV